MGSDLLLETWGSAADRIGCGPCEVFVRFMNWIIPLLVLGGGVVHSQGPPRLPGQLKLPSKTNLIGDRALESGAIQEAIDIFEEGLERRPRSKRFLIGLIRAQSQMNRCDIAEQLLAPQQHTRVANRQVLEALAACYSRFGAYADAVYWQEERVYLAPPTPAAFARLASYQLGAGDRFAARQAFDRALELDPFDSSVFVLKLQIAIGKGLVEEADRLFVEWGQIDPDRSQMNWYLRSRLALDVGEFDGAMEMSHNAVKMGFQFSPVRVLRAEMFRRLGLLSNAEEAVSSLARGDVGVVGIDSVKVRILADQRRFREAHERLEALEQNAPLRADVVASAWYLAHVEGDLEEQQLRSEMYALVQSNPYRTLERLIPISSAGETQ